MFALTSSQLITLLSVGAALFGISTASPVDASASDSDLLPPFGLPGRHRNEVSFCRDVDFKGQCTTVRFRGNECTNVPEGFNDVTSAFRVPGGATCTLFMDYNCSGRSMILRRPDANLIDDNFNDLVSSFKCFNH